MNTKTASTTLYATRGFKDAGTGKEYEAGAPLDGIDEGTADNYRAAGVASTTKPTTEKATAAPAA